MDEDSDESNSDDSITDTTYQLAGSHSATDGNHYIGARENRQFIEEMKQENFDIKLQLHNYENSIKNYKELLNKKDNELEQLTKNMKNLMEENERLRKNLIELKSAMVPTNCTLLPRKCHLEDEITDISVEKNDSEKAECGQLEEKYLQYIPKGVVPDNEPKDVATTPTKSFTINPRKVFQNSKPSELNRNKSNMCINTSTDKDKKIMKRNSIRNIFRRNKNVPAKKPQ